MKILHTGDWHVGKVLRGVPRLPEQEQVLAEIVQVAEGAQVDLVLVAGDLFDSAAPSAEAQRLVWRTLLDLRATGADVAVIAGNHDSADALDAVAPVFGQLGVTLVGRPRRPDDGGVLAFAASRTGEPVRLALLPFVSQRGIVRAEHLMDLGADEAAGRYGERLKAVLEALCQSFTADSVNLVLAHLTVVDATLGGGEREAQTVFSYWVSAQVFPPSAGYVALGHLHRAQAVPARCPAWYAGAPFAVDFGEQADQAKGVLLVEASPGSPATVDRVPLRSPRRLRTLRGTFDQVVALVDELDDDLVKVVLTEPARAGLADEVRTRVPNVVEVRIEAPPRADGELARPARLGRDPLALFHEYCTGQGIEDDDLEALFGALLDEVVHEEPA